MFKKPKTISDKEAKKKMKKHGIPISEFDHHKKKQWYIDDREKKLDSIIEKIRKKKNKKELNKKEQTVKKVKNKK